MNVSSSALRAVSAIFEKAHNRLRRWGVLRGTRHVAWMRIMSLSPIRRILVEDEDGIVRDVRLNSLAEVTAAVGRAAEDGVASSVRQLRTGDVFIDVGANVGRYTLIASKLVGQSGKVYAFEPAPETFQALQRNREINNAGNVIAVNAAVSDVDGETSISFGSDSGWSTLHQDWLWHVGKENAVRATTVRTINLEAFVKAEVRQRIALVKIDVEGHEMTILRSVSGLISPAIVENWVVEVHRPIVEPEDVASIFTKAGYRVRQTREFVYAS